MPKMVKEVYAGVQYDFSSEEGQIASSTTRVFRIIKSDVGEYINVAATCGVQIGQEHPSESGLYCASYSAQYDGDSRMVIVATFNYRTTPGGGDAGQDPGQFSPDIRPANWSISTTLQEAPASKWKPFGTAASQGIGGTEAWQTPVNPAGDRYEGVVELVPITTISVEQFELSDPTRHSQQAGFINDSPTTIGSLACARHTLMFRGVSMQPALEQHGTVLYRGWKATYEFLYKRNRVQLDAFTSIDLGWDHAQIVEGINIINRSYGSVATAEGANVEAGSLALKKKESTSGIATEIDGWPNTISVAENTAGKKVRGMILIGEDAKPTQRPCALPIALNPDGSPRWNGATPPVLVYTYQVQDDYDFSNFGLRLT